jgi:hypothetical protein
MPSQFAVPKQEGIHPCKASAVLSQHCNTIYSVQYRSEARYSRRHKESTCFHSVERALYGSSIPFHYRSIPVYYGVECDPRRSIHAQSVPFRFTVPRPRLVSRAIFSRQGAAAAEAARRKSTPTMVFDQYVKTRILPLGLATKLYMYTYDSSPRRHEKPLMSLVTILKTIVRGAVTNGWHGERTVYKSGKRSP